MRTEALEIPYRFQEPWTPIVRANRAGMYVLMIPASNPAWERCQMPGTGTHLTRESAEAELAFLYRQERLLCTPTPEVAAAFAVVEAARKRQEAEFRRTGMTAETQRLWDEAVELKEAFHALVAALAA